MSEQFIPGAYLGAYREAARHQLTCDPRGLSVGRPWPNCMGPACRGLARASGFLGHLRARYAHAVPTPEALAAVAEVAPSGVVEVGAGAGYWAGELRALGVDVVAYDPDPDGTCYGWHAGPSWSPVALGDERAAGAHPNRTLLLCWPEATWSTAAVAAHVAAGGATVVYVGQDHDRPRQLTEPARVVELPQWAGCTDQAEVYDLGASEESR